MKLGSSESRRPSIEHACTTMGVVVSLAGLLALLASAISWSPIEVMLGIWCWLALGLATVAQRIHRGLSPLFWPSRPLPDPHHEPRHHSVSA